MKFKQTIGAAAAVVIAFALVFTATLASHAQGVNNYVLQGSATVAAGLNGWTNSVAPSTSFTNITKIQVPQGTKELSLDISVRSDAADTTVKSFWIGRNNSGLTGITNIDWFRVIPVTSTGPTLFTTTTNLYLNQGAYPYYYVGIVTNAGGTANLTNYSIYPYAK